MTVQTGLDAYLQAPDVQGPVGLLTNAASQTSDGRTAFRALREAGLDVVTLFTPEHGYFAVAAQGESVGHSRWGDVTVFSLYGANLTPPIELLTPLSTLIIDLQNVGTRWYTFLGTVLNAIRACAEAEVPLLLLDRPNPIGGIMVEGMLPRAGYVSLVAPAALPIRYGLTSGEAARWLNRDIGASLDVITMRDWQRDMLFEDTGLVWVSPSPGIPHARTALIYAATCLIEALNVSEGRGTALPFEQIGAPFIRGEALSDALNALELPSVAFRPCWFQPTADKFAGQPCQGVRVHVTEPTNFEGLRVGLHLVQTIRNMYPEAVQWVDIEGKNWFDCLTGSGFIRQSLENGQTIEEILDACDDEAKAFQSASTEVWLYE